MKGKGRYYFLNFSYYKIEAYFFNTLHTDFHKKRILVLKCFKPDKQ